MRVISEITVIKRGASMCYVYGHRWPSRGALSYRFPAFLRLCCSVFIRLSIFSDQRKICLLKFLFTDKLCVFFPSQRFTRKRRLLFYCRFEIIASITNRPKSIVKHVCNSVTFARAFAIVCLKSRPS